LADWEVIRVLFSPAGVSSSVARSGFDQDDGHCVPSLGFVFSRFHGCCATVVNLSARWPALCSAWFLISWKDHLVTTVLGQMQRAT
jgi:hypothetical protein